MKTNSSELFFSANHLRGRYDELAAGIKTKPTPIDLFPFKLYRNNLAGLDDAVRYRDARQASVNRVPTHRGGTA